MTAMQQQTKSRGRPTRAIRPDPRLAARDGIRHLDAALNNLWKLGRNLIIGWSPRDVGIDLLVVPQYLLSDVSETYPELLKGTHAMALDDLCRTANRFRLKPRALDLPFTPGKGVSLKAVASVVRRYSVTKSEFRAAILFDIVGFSLYSPIEQVTLLNSLAYSINVAHSRALASGLRIDLGRTTTGDGFYVWNRDDGIGADINLFHMMMLIMADNALARLKGSPNTTPVLRTCFHNASHYEYYQAEGLSPATNGYIVGDLTIELARMVNKTLPGQILIGSFDRPTEEADETMAAGAKAPTPVFMSRAQNQLDRLKVVNLAGERITAIKVYLTGERVSHGVFNVKKYSILDKHGLRRDVFNAKVNIYRGDASPLYLGLENKDLERFDAVEGQYRPETDN
jgi:hypothetical protein